MDRCPFHRNQLRAVIRRSPFGFGQGATATGSIGMHGVDDDAGGVRTPPKGYSRSEPSGLTG